MRTDARTVAPAEWLQRNRQGHHLAQKVVEPNHRTLEPAGLEVFAQAQSVLREAPDSLRICGHTILHRRENQPEIFTKRLRVAFGAAAALEPDPSRQPTFENDLLMDPLDPQIESEGRLDLEELVPGHPVAIFPPLPTRLEHMMLFGPGQPIHGELEFSHALVPGVDGLARSAQKPFENKKLANRRCRPGK